MKPILFILWALRQLPGLARSAANRVFKDMEGAGNDLESLSWEVLWVAVIRIEEGIVQVITFRIWNNMISGEGKAFWMGG